MIQIPLIPILLLASSFALWGTQGFGIMALITAVIFIIGD